MYQSKKPYLYGTGRRKSSVARVRLFQNGTGAITINGRDIDEYFGLETLKMVVRQPLAATEELGKVDIVATVEGGGVMRQIGMKYQYSYEEQWQPKDLLVTFRLYQLNLDGNGSRVYQKYWNESAVHFVEEEVSAHVFPAL